MRKTNHFKIRESAVIILGIVVMFFTSVGIAQSAGAIALKQNSLVETDVITLGDVFAGLDDGKAAKVLGPAPRPGQDMVLNARTLLRVALAMDLSWRPVSSAEYVVLKRAASVVPKDAAEDALKREISAQGLGGKFDLMILRGNTELALPPSEEARVEVESMNFDQSKNRFEAVLVAPSKDNPILRENVSGMVQRLVQVPVLRQTIKNGMIIDAGDIDTLDVRAEFVKHDMILSEDELIGKTPRRLISAGEAITENEIEPPQVVKRGEFVTMVFENGMLSLTAKAKALENGAEGQMIRVVNEGSNRTLEAKVTGFKEVSVSSF